MSAFTLEEIYGVTREEYCELTGITPQELVMHLEAEVAILNKNLCRLNDEYRSGGPITDEDQRYRAKLLTDVRNKIISKTNKIMQMSHLIPRPCSHTFCLT